MLTLISTFYLDDAYATKLHTREIPLTVSWFMHSRSVAYLSSPLASSQSKTTLLIKSCLPACEIYHLYFQRQDRQIINNVQGLNFIVRYGLTKK